MSADRIDLSHLKGIVNTNDDPGKCVLCLRALNLSPSSTEAWELYPPVGVGEGTRVLSCCGKELCVPCYESLDGMNGGVMSDGIQIVLRNDGEEAYCCRFCNEELPFSAKELTEKLAKSTSAIRLKKNAKKKYAWAQLCLGIISEQKGEPYDAVRWYRKAADLGHPNALYRLAGKYFQGKGCGMDLMAARDILVRARSSHTGYTPVCVSGLCMIALEHFTEANFEEAKSILYPIAEANFGEAQSLLGLVLYFSNEQICNEEAHMWNIKGALNPNGSERCRDWVNVSMITGMLKSKEVYPSLRVWLKVLVSQVKSYEKKMGKEPCLAPNFVPNLQAELMSLRDKCAECGKALHDGTIKTCKSCQVACYCSRDCQRRHWNRKAGHAAGCVNTLPFPSTSEW